MKEERDGEREEGRREEGKGKEGDPSAALDNRIPLSIWPSLENFSSFLELLPFFLAMFCSPRSLSGSAILPVPLAVKCSSLAVCLLQKRLLSASESVSTPAEPHLTKGTRGQAIFS